ncbi:MAG: hypothetical protein N2688_00480 [Burkholderiaceae bacterium]|nr:hypothetical protein [Burkholderiaceae bacterium]
MRSNCLVEAWFEHWRRMRLWRLLGRPKGGEPYRVQRPSRNEPRWINHRLVGRWRDCPHCGGGIQVESFKPDKPVDVPVWQVWRHLWFAGRWVAGDKHTEP